MSTLKHDLDRIRISAPRSGRPVSFWMRVWRLVSLTSSLLLISSATCAFAEVGADRTIALVEIATFDQSMAYNVASSNGVVRVMRVASQSTDQTHMFANVLANLRTKLIARSQAAVSIDGRIDQPIKWADVSPNNGLVFAGVQDPRLSAVTSGTIFKVPGLEPLMHVESAGRI